MYNVLLMLLLEFLLSCFVSEQQNLSKKRKNTDKKDTFQLFVVYSVCCCR